MSTAPRDGATDAPDAAERLRAASFVRVVTRADGDGVAAAGVLARALSAAGIPFQVAAARTREGRARRVDRAEDHATEGDRTVVVGGPTTGDAVGIDAVSTPASVGAWELARALAEAAADPVLALAGAVAAGTTPGGGGTAGALSAAEDELDRRPGLAVPTADLADGLAHSTLVHGPFSGDPEAAADELAAVLPGDPAAAGRSLDERGRRTVASLTALRVAGDPAAVDRAGEAVERALRPYATPSAPFATLGGYADVLDAAARAAPGTAIALALGHDARESALTAWREHGAAAHGAVREAETARYDGLLAARVDGGPVGTVARILRAYRSPEPVVLAVGERAAALAGPPDRDLGAALRGVEDADAAVGAVPGRAYARFEDPVDPDAVTEAVREGSS